MSFSFVDYRRFLVRAGWCGLPVAMLLCLAGCNILGAVAYKMSGPPTVEAKYQLPNVPTLVLAENYDNSGSGSDADMLALYVQDKLEEKRTDKDNKDNKDHVPTLIGLDKLADLKSHDPANFHKLSIPRVGKALGADQIIYIDFNGAGISSMGGATVQGNASATVRVVDCNSGQTLWPLGSAQGQPVTFQTDVQRTGELTQEDLRAQTFDGLAENIVNLFFKWQQKDD